MAYTGTLSGMLSFIHSDAATNSLFPLFMVCFFACAEIVAVFAVSIMIMSSANAEYFMAVLSGRLCFFDDFMM